MCPLKLTSILFASKNLDKIIIYASFDKFFVENSKICALLVYLKKKNEKKQIIKNEYTY